MVCIKFGFCDLFIKSCKEVVDMQFQVNSLLLVVGSLCKTKLIAESNLV